MIRSAAIRLAIAMRRVALGTQWRRHRGTPAWRCMASVLVVATGMLGARPAGACLSDSDCNDGLFCTTDHCIFFVCAHFDRDCNDFNDCTRDSCDEVRNVCAHEPLGFNAGCEDFNIFTTAERCNCGGECVGLPTGLIGGTVFVSPVRCCVSADCPSDQFCLDTLCVANPTPAATPTRTRTPTVTPTRTLTPTPDNRPVLSIDDVAGNEGDSGTKNWVFTVALSKAVDQKVTFNFATADGSASAGSDYRAKSGTATIAKNTLAVRLPGITVFGDTVPEAQESFLVNLTNVPSTVRVARGTGVGIIVNDDFFPFIIPGLGALSPHDGVATVDATTPVTLTWTNPQRWRDLTTVDLRLRNQRGIAIWLRFDVAANTLGLIHPSDVSPGPAFPPGTDATLDGQAVSVVLADSLVDAAGPDDPSVNVTLAFRFGPQAVGETYLVDAAATDVAGEVQDFDTIGSISVATTLPCPGDCNHDGMVSVDELVLGTNIALDTMSSDSCPDFDTDGSGTVEIGELIAAVNAALQGCT